MNSRQHSDEIAGQVNALVATLAGDDCEVLPTDRVYELLPDPFDQRELLLLLEDYFDIDLGDSADDAGDLTISELCDLVYERCCQS